MSPNEVGPETHQARYASPSNFDLRSCYSQVVIRSLLEYAYGVIEHFCTKVIRDVKWPLGDDRKETGEAISVTECSPLDIGWRTWGRKRCDIALEHFHHAKDEFW